MKAAARPLLWLSFETSRLPACSSSGLTGAVEHKVRRSFPLEIKDVIGSEHSIGEADGARLPGRLDRTSRAPKNE